MLLFLGVAMPFLGLPGPVHAQHAAADEDITETNPKEAEKLEGQFLTGTRQLTFEGRRAGEGYFSGDGRQMVFQSEREPGNPFFQIYVMDVDTGDIEKVSPGTGKTTCAWIHPESYQVLFASTQDDPEAVAKVLRQHSEAEIIAHSVAGSGVCRISTIEFELADSGPSALSARQGFIP